MTAKVTIAGGTTFDAHPLRAAVLSEVHARPFTPVQMPCRILHFAFDTSGDAGNADRAVIADLCARHNAEPPGAGAKQHRIRIAGATLRWEQHSEFTTYTWELPSESTPFHPPSSALRTPMS